MNTYPKIEAVKAITNKCLLITFHNGVQKVYDCTSLLKEEIFSPLTNDILFQSVKVDIGGYGIIWNDEIDLSESELWTHGCAAEPGDAADAGTFASIKS